MLPLTEGVAYGRTTTRGQTYLGYGVDDTGTYGIGLWASSTGIPEELSLQESSITGFVDTPIQDANLAYGVYFGARGNLQKADINGSLLLARDAFLTNTNFSNSTLFLNAFSTGDGDTVRNSVAAITGEFLTHPSTFDNSILLGNMFNVAGTVGQAICLKPTRGLAPITMADNSVYIGNGSVPATLNANEFHVGPYTSFKFDTIPAATAPEVLYYNNATSAVTRGALPVAPGYVLPQKLPTTLGGTFGINSVSGRSEVCGNNSFTNYAASPVQLAGMTAIGQSLFSANIPASTTFTDSIVMGNTQVFPRLITMASSILALHNTNMAMTRITDSIAILPKSGSVTSTYIGQMTNATMVSSATVNMSRNPNCTSMLASGGSINPGETNLVLSSNIVGNIDLSGGTGNTFIQSFNAGLNYTLGAFNNCTILHSSDIPALPTADRQLVISHDTIRAPTFVTVTATTNPTQYLCYQNNSKTFVTVNSNTMSRVMRGPATTNASGIATFSIATLGLASAVDVYANANARNNSSTIAYTCNIIAVTTAAVTIRVFRSTTVVLAAQSMVSAGAGIVLDIAVHY
jgi:hypothetical protein